MSAGYHVAIVGGGIVGSALALMLAQNARIPAPRILLLEREPPAPPRPGEKFDLRVSAVSPANRALLEQLGAWQCLDASRVCAYERMVVWQEATPPDSPDVLRFDAAELDEPDLGSIVENRALQAALLRRCIDAGVTPRCDLVRGIVFAPDSATLELESSVVSAELVVGADGANSRVREAAGINADSHDYGQRAIVATVQGRGGADTAWQRFLSTGPLALLPLASGEHSIVWSMVDDGSRVDGLLACAPEEFNAALTTASAGVLGNLELRSGRAVFPLRRMQAARYVSERCALAGDAAHVIHPLAGQGVNQGLQDAAALAAALAARPARESIGARRALLRYQRERRSGNAAMGMGVHGLDQLFTRGGEISLWAAREGMSLVNRSQIAKRFFFTQATGRSSPRR
jgi:2-polyprenylphenol 6-hydroxylase